jgi:energy-coupling factor transport system ATP-binding protein
MLILEPDLLILDEPSYAQDAGNLSNLVEQIFRLAEQKNGTIVFITHDLGLVSNYATRVIVLDQSHKVFDGSPRELFLRRDLLKKNGLSTTPVMDLVRNLNEHGWSLPADWVTVDQFINHAELVQT